MATPNQQTDDDKARDKRLREFIKHQPKDTQKTLRQVLRDQGLLGGDE